MLLIKINIMKNKIINTFASIGVITVIAIACSSALYEDDDITIPNNITESIVDTSTSGSTATNTGTTNTSTSGSTTTNTAVQQSEIGRYQISTIEDGAYAKAFIIDTTTGSFMRVTTNTNNTWIPLPN